MHQSVFSSVMQAMSDHGITVEKGLSDVEMNNMESAYSIKLPPDLKAFLSLGLPVSDGFINWRSKNKVDILHKLQFPVTAIMFKVEYHNFWLESWGVRPCEPDMAYEVAFGQLKSQPKLIPVYKYSYIPEEPHEIGNPVLSVRKSQITYEANDLVQFFIKEFQMAVPENSSTIETKEIAFWSQVAQ